MSSDVLAALGMDRSVDPTEKFILIKEMSGSEAFFINSSLMAKQFKEQGAICLVTLHNSFQHYQSVGMKLGYNLQKLKESGSVECVDCLNLLNDENAGNELTINKLFGLIRKAIINLLVKKKTVNLIVDDLTGLLDLSFTIIEVNAFVRMCKGLIGKYNCGIVLGVHVISESDQTYMLSNMISHMADIICEVSGFKTGRSRELSGAFTVNRPWSNETSVSNNIVKLNSFHFKIFDRGIKVFAPGMK